MIRVQTTKLRRFFCILHFQDHPDSVHHWSVITGKLVVLLAEIGEHALVSGGGGRLEKLIAVGLGKTNWL